MATTYGAVGLSVALLIVQLSAIYHTVLMATWAISALLLLASSAVGATGAWCVTTAPRRLVDPAKGTGLRPLVRGGILIGLGLESILFASAATDWSPSETVRAAFPALVWVCVTAKGVGLIALVVYLRRLALLIPDPRLAGGTRVFLWALAVPMVMVIANFTAAAFSDSRPAANRALLHCVFWGCVFSVVWLALLGFYWRRLRKQIAVGTDAGQSHGRDMP